MPATKYQLYTTNPDQSNFAYSDYMFVYRNPAVFFFGDTTYRDRLFLLNTGELVYGNYASYRSTHERKDKLYLGVGTTHDELVIYKQFDILGDLFSFTTIEQLAARKHVLLERRDKPLYEGSSSYYYDYIDAGRLFWDDEGVYIRS